MYRSPPSDSQTLEATRVASCRDVPQRVSSSSFGIESSCSLLLSFRWRESFVFHCYINTILSSTRSDSTTIIAFCPSATFGTTNSIDVIYLHDSFATLVPPNDSSNPSPMKLSPPSKVFLQDPTFGIRAGTEELQNRAYSRSSLSRCFETMTFSPTVDLPNSIRHGVLFALDDKKHQDLECRYLLPYISRESFAFSFFTNAEV